MPDSDFITVHEKHCGILTVLLSYFRMIFSSNSIHLHTILVLK